ncbi:MAG: FAD-dependent oxidoreductase [Planctomycetota bacterium]|nr:MAG: FAD-dependent oxidoreductase [Planctomycetota bacterium]
MRHHRNKPTEGAFQRTMTMTIAIIGAGMAGIACARVLHEAGYAVNIFDKARGPSGRMASRRHELGICDHGAKYFTARDPGFRQQVEQWRQHGAVSAWQGRIDVWENGSITANNDHIQRFIGTPRMSACLRHASSDLPVRVGLRITALQQDDDLAWWCYDHQDGKHGPYSLVLGAIPAPQAAELLPRQHPFQGALAEVRMAPCWAVMLWLDAEVATSWDALRLKNHPVLDWISCEHRRPGRGGEPRVVLHANPEWSQEHVEDDPESVTVALRSAFSEIIQAPCNPVAQSAHRWRYARSVDCLGKPCLFDPASGVGLAGDWCLDARIEAAWLSGTALGLIASQHTGALS